MFNNVKKINDKGEQSKEFGIFIDRRASTPITIGNRIETKSPEYTPLKTEKDSKLLGLFKIKDNYFREQPNSAIKNSDSAVDIKSNGLSEIETNEKK